MAFDPEEFLHLAKNVHADPGRHDAANVRTAVSRCYYSSMLKAKLLLERSGVKFSIDDIVHTEVINAINAKDPSLGDDLEEINKLRMAADLDVTSSVSVGVLTSAYGISESFSACVERRFRHLPGQAP